MRTGGAALSSVAFTLVAAGVAHAQSAPICDLQPETGVLTVTVDRQLARLTAETSGEVTLNDAPCDGATVDNTERIDIVGGALDDRVTLEGRFEPGRTPEVDGASEIEISFALGNGSEDKVTMNLANGGTHLVFTSAGIDVRNDLDEDITTAGTEILVVNARGGNDRIDASAYTGTGTNGWLEVHGGDGDDRVQGTLRNDRLFGDGGNDVLNGSAGNDRLTGGMGDDILRGDAGFDEFYAEATADGSDRMVGGSSTDSVHYDARTAGFGVSVTMDDGQANDGQAGENDEVIGIENAYGGAGPDVLVGTAVANFLQGNSGPDEIYGGAGNDTLQGLNGNDILVGDDGDDLLLGQQGADTLDGGDGDDEMYAHAGRDVLIGGPGQDILQGNEDDDTIYNADGFRDRVFCGDGIDDAEPDPLDNFLDVCEL